MNEDLLQYIWQFQLFNQQHLFTTHGVELKIIKPGTLNRNQGPDFLEARVTYDDVSWAGCIELHVQSSDWQKHGHEKDANYSNVILHVVWEEDCHMKLPFPTLELKPLVSKILLVKYASMMQQQKFIPCENLIHSVHELSKKKWLDRLGAERFEKKANLFTQQLFYNKMDWEETIWQYIAGVFGGKVNGEAFVNIAKLLPYHLIQKIKTQTDYLESILLGVAGLLPEKPEDSYTAKLITEYEYYSRKYRISAQEKNMMFLRMRPVSFPTIRLVQLAAFISNCSSLTSTLTCSEGYEKMIKNFDISLNAYWNTHYTFEKKGAVIYKKIGEDQIRNFLVNVWVTLQFAHSKFYGHEEKLQKVIQVVMQIKPEKNHITRQFQKLGIFPLNAYDTQALLELKSAYCDKQRCLECGIGFEIFKVNGKNIEAVETSKIQASNQ